MKVLAFYFCTFILMIFEMPDKFLSELDDPKFDYIYSDKTEVTYLEILCYPSVPEPIQRFECTLNDDDSLDAWLSKVSFPITNFQIQIQY